MLRKTLLATCCAAALISAPAFAAAPEELKSEQGILEVSTIAQGLEHPWRWRFCLISKACWLPNAQGVCGS